LLATIAHARPSKPRNLRDLNCLHCCIPINVPCRRYEVTTLRVSYSSLSRSVCHRCRLSVHKHDSKILLLALKHIWHKYTTFMHNIPMLDDYFYFLFMFVASSTILANGQQAKVWDGNESNVQSTETSTLSHTLSHILNNTIDVTRSVSPCTCWRYFVLSMIACTQATYCALC
jgi:hypothetical protein